MSLIEARVGRAFEAGTDCTVYLALKNRGTAETCQTGPLDSPGNSWAYGDTEEYDYIHYDFSNCRNFRPKENFLQFKIHLDSFCIDHLQLYTVRVSFGRKYFDWSGRHWFNPSSNWIDFDSNGIDENYDQLIQDDLRLFLVVED